MKRTVLFGFLSVEFQNIEPVIYRKVVAYIIKVKCEEVTLCLLQREFYFTCLQNLVRVIR